MIRSRFLLVAVLIGGASLSGFARQLVADKPSVAETDDRVIGNWMSTEASAQGTPWERERFPLGNGRLGTMMSGGIGFENAQFNVDSLWTGDLHANGNYGRMGEYQNFGYLNIKYARKDGQAWDGQNYQRTLDLATAIHTVKHDGVVCTSFVSAPANMFLMRILSPVPVTVEVAIQGAHGEKSTPIEGENAVTFSGVLKNKLSYTARADWRQVSETEVIIVLRAKTSYEMADESFGLGKTCAPYERLGATPLFDSLKAEHSADYERYFKACQLELPDDEVVARLFDFGRYLLICSSRPGTLPANLQGIWNNSNKPAWHCDYHTNINLEMNYWAADTTNLFDLWEPLATWMTRIVPIARRETRNAFPQSKGFAYRTSLNAFGSGGWKWNFAGAPWLAIMLYDHALFTGNKADMERVWPLLEESTEFMMSHLKEGPSGELLVRDGWSPEHGPENVDGVMHDQQLMAELLKAVCGAGETMGIAQEKLSVYRETLKKLGGNRIGSWGQLQEWQEDWDKKGDTHRHTSHLYAVYPGSTITQETPAFFEAAKVSLTEGRALTGDSRRSWTWPWRAALWARLQNGEKANERLQGLLKYNVYPNGLTTHPPFQIDGNLGFPAAVAEMLVQSHEVTAEGKRRIRILPAIPKAWRSGSVTGLRIRGGGTVSIRWQDGKLVSYEIQGGDASKRTVVLGLEK